MNTDKRTLKAKHGTNSNPKSAFYFQAIPAIRAPSIMINAIALIQ